MNLNEISIDNQHSPFSEMEKKCGSQVKNGENVVGPFKFRRNFCGLKHNNFDYLKNSGTLFYTVNCKFS